MSELTTKWPDVKEHTFEHVWLDASGTEIVEPPIFDERTYYRASFEAALERLRLAVKTLHWIALKPNQDIENGAFTRGYCESTKVRAAVAQVALDAIGHLPDLPPVQKEG